MRNRIIFRSFVCIIVYVSSALLVYAVPPLNVVKKVWYSNDTVTITLDTVRSNTPPKYTYSFASGNRFYIDIQNSTVSPEYSRLDVPINLDDVAQIRRGQYDPTTARVVVQFNKPDIKPTVTYIGGNTPKLVISWEGSAAKAKQKKYVILIDPGHGGKDFGAVGPVKNLKEKYVTLDIALKLEKELLENRKDIDVKLTRRSDIYIDLKTRREITKRIKPDIFISIHVNSIGGDNMLNQTEIYYYDPKSISLANTVRDELVQQLNRSEGHIRRTPYVVIYKNPATYGSVLVESCYISSHRGEEKLSRDDYRREIAKGLFNSINSFLSSVGN